MLKNVFNTRICFILCACILLGSGIAYGIFQSKPKISVILPTYNREKMLPNALDSILNQTFPDFELIVINDGSTDNTQKILEEYAAKDKRIKIINHEKNKGIVWGLNEGLEQAKGEYIARMDDDDISYPKRFEIQLAYMQEHPDVAIVGTWVSTSNDKTAADSWWKETKSELIKIKMLLGINPLAHPTFMMRRSFLKNHHIQYKDKYLATEDFHLLADVMLAGGKLENIPKTLLYLRKHRSNSQQYYHFQEENRKRCLKDYLKLIFDIDIEGDVPEKCILLKMIKNHNTKGFIDPRKIEKFNSQDWMKCQI